MALEDLVVYDLKNTEWQGSESNDGDEESTAVFAETFSMAKHLSSRAQIYIDVDCNESMLESMDDCVGCVDGVHSQHEFEINGGGTKEFIDHFGAPRHQALSPTEVALIRLQLMESKRQQSMQEEQVLQDMDVLELCGSYDASTKAVISPTPKSTKRAETADESFSDKYGNSEVNPFHMCAICKDKSHETRQVSFCQFPCCTDESGVRVCTSCLLVTTTPSADGQKRVGHCPRCKSWILVTTPKSYSQSQLHIEPITLGDPAWVCKICNQNKEFLADQDECDACFLGRRYALIYECESCGCAQRIPHPLYRYQASPAKFGKVKWSCQGRSCGGFTNWRILSDQVELIPVGDAPTSWNVNSIQAARKKVIKARRAILSYTVNEEKGVMGEECVIL